MTDKVTKRAQAVSIFESMLAKRDAGEFESNKEFRAATIAAFQDKLEVSGSSACTLYNVNKKRAMEEDPSLSLGRDPAKGRQKAPKVETVVVKTKVEAHAQAPKVDVVSAIDLDPIDMLDYTSSDVDVFDELGIDTLY